MIYPNTSTTFKSIQRQVPCEAARTSVGSSNTNIPTYLYGLPQLTPATQIRDVDEGTRTLHLENDIADIRDENSSVAHFPYTVSPSGISSFAQVWKFVLISGEADITELTINRRQRIRTTRSWLYRTTTSHPSTMAILRQL